jgi:hypothetical protein
MIHNWRGRAPGYHPHPQKNKKQKKKPKTKLVFCDFLGGTTIFLG